MKPESIMDAAPDSKGILQQGLAERHYGADDDNSNGSDSDSDSNYVSFDGIEDEESHNTKETREREQLVLEAAGLVVNQDVKPPPKKSTALHRLSRNLLRPGIKIYLKSQILEERLIEKLKVLIMKLVWTMLLLVMSHFATIRQISSVVRLSQQTR